MRSFFVGRFHSKFFCTIGRRQKRAISTACTGTLPSICSKAPCLRIKAILTSVSIHHWDTMYFYWGYNKRLQEKMQHSREQGKSDMTKRKGSGGFKAPSIKDGKKQYALL